MRAWREKARASAMVCVLTIEVENNGAVMRHRLPVWHATGLDRQAEVSVVEGDREFRLSKGPVEFGPRVLWMVWCAVRGLAVGEVFDFDRRASEPLEAPGAELDPGEPAA